MPCSYLIGMHGRDGKAFHVNDFQALSRVGPMRIKVLQVQKPYPLNLGLVTVKNRLWLM